MGKGQKALILSEGLHKTLVRSWERNKEKLEKKYDVNTFSGYAQSLIKKGIDEDLLETRFEIMYRYENEVKVRDYFLGKDATVKLNVEGSYATFYCDLEKTGRCPHVGFVLSDPQVLKTAKQHGIALHKSPKSVTVEEAMDVFDNILGKRLEISEKEFVSESTSGTSYSVSQAKEMLKVLYGDYRIEIKRERAGTFYFRKVVP